MKKMRLRRKTRETDIVIELGLRGQGRHQIKTGIPFLDHMLSLFARHGLFDLKLTAQGDLEVDRHHTNEDVAICLGKAFSGALTKKISFKRFGDATVPMDEALVRVTIDISGRPFLKFNTASVKVKEAASYSLNYAEQFLRAFSLNFPSTIHVDILEGKDAHHVLEAIFKAFARAMMAALEKEPRSKTVPSTKGCL